MAQPRVRMSPMLMEERSGRSGARGAGGSGEEDDAQEGKRGAQEGVPARRAGAGRAQARNRGEQRHKDDDESGDESGFRGRGVDETDGLELIAGGEAESHQRAGGDLPRADTAPGTVIGDGEDEEGERHARQVERGRGRFGQRRLDEHERRSPHGDDVRSMRR